MSLLVGGVNGHVLSMHVKYPPNRVFCLGIAHMNRLREDLCLSDACTR